MSPYTSSWPHSNKHSRRRAVKQPGLHFSLKRQTCICGSLSTNSLKSLTVLAPCRSSNWADTDLAFLLSVGPTALKFWSSRQTDKILCQDRSGSSQKALFNHILLLQSTLQNHPVLRFSAYSVVIKKKRKGKILKRNLKK